MMFLAAQSEEEENIRTKLSTISSFSDPISSKGLCGLHDLVISYSFLSFVTSQLCCIFLMIVNKSMLY